jgi:hypothetical protein
MLFIRPVPQSNYRSFWVEVEATRGNFEWVGNLHKLKNGLIEACPKDNPCNKFENPYLAMDYIKSKIGDYSNSYQLINAIGMYYAILVVNH